MIEAECYLWGENFSPSSLVGHIKELKFKNSSEPQDIGTSGRYKGNPKPYGACSLLIPENILVENRIIWMADFIINNKNIFLNAGASEIDLHIYYYGIQGNIEFKIEEIAKIAKASVPLAITYIQQESE